MIDVDFVQGQRVRLVENTYRNPVGYWNGESLDADTLGTVQEVKTNKVRVTLDGKTHIQYGELRNKFFWIEKDLLAPTDGPLPRQLGEVPEDGISPKDPRIQWLWEDAAKLAKRKGYCAQYDALTSALGIPGRPRNFKVSIVLADGITASATQRARTKEEAEELVREKLQGAVPVVGKASDE